MDRINGIFHHRRFGSELRNIEADEKDRKFCRHGIEHLMDVARLMYIHDLETGGRTPRDLIYAAALLHDIGRHAQYAEGTPHDEAGAAIAGEIMGDCGFSEEEIRQVTEAIRAHRNEESASGGETLGEMLYRADKESRLCFACGARDECNWPEEKMNLKVGV